MLKYDLNVRLQLYLKPCGYKHGSVRTHTEMPLIHVQEYQNPLLHWSAMIDNDEGNLIHVELRSLSSKTFTSPWSAVGWFLVKVQCQHHVMRVLGMAPPWGTTGLSPHCHFSVTLHSLNLPRKLVFFFKSTSQVPGVRTLIWWLHITIPQLLCQALLPSQ